MEEGESKQKNLENKEKLLDSEYKILLAMIKTRRGHGDAIDIVTKSEGLGTLV